MCGIKGVYALSIAPLGGDYKGVFFSKNSASYSLEAQTNAGGKFNQLALNFAFNPSLHVWQEAFLRSLAYFKIKIFADDGSVLEVGANEEELNIRIQRNADIDDLINVTVTSSFLCV